MNEGSRSPKLIFEEEKAVTLFLWLFYILYFTYEITWYYILPSLKPSEEFHFPQGGLGSWHYIFVMCLLPLSIRFIKKNNPYPVKYIILFGYISLELINILLMDYSDSVMLSSGNIVDLLFVFISPIFVNRKYHLCSTTGLIGKYLLIGIILKETYMFFPIIIIVILSAIAFILLIRFNSYINSLTSVYEELRKKEKLAVIGQMAAGVGHEIRNPLASLKGFTQLQMESNSNSNEFYPIMIQEIERINSIVDDLMYLGKPRQINFEKANIEEIINYTLSITKHQSEAQVISVETYIPNHIPFIESDEKQLKQVFINLIKNAIEAMPGGGKLKILVNVIEHQKLLISIEDSGYGIDEENIQNLGVPFYTTKKDGTGLGLMVTNQIIKDHNGGMKIESKHGKGTKVTLTLPISQ